MRTYDEIKKGVIDAFLRDYPGEAVHSCAFSAYILDIYCRLMEVHELYRHAVKTNNFN